MNIYLEAEKELAELLGYLDVDTNRYTACNWIKTGGNTLTGEHPNGCGRVLIARWCSDSAAAFELMVEHGLAVYVDNHEQGCQCVEVEEYTNHSRILVNFSDHVDKTTTTRYAIVKAVIAKLKG